MPHLLLMLPPQPLLLTWQELTWLRPLLPDPPPSLAFETPPSGSALPSGEQAQAQGQGQGAPGVPGVSATSAPLPVESAVERALALLQQKQQQRQGQQAKGRQGPGQGRKAGGEKDFQGGRREGEEGQSAGAGVGAAREVTAGVPGLSLDEAVERALSKLSVQQKQQGQGQAQKGRGQGRGSSSSSKRGGCKVRERRGRVLALVLGPHGRSPQVCQASPLKRQLNEP